jgi:excisionase family DNA binding protein
MAPSNTQVKRLYTIKEAAASLSLSRAQLYRLIDTCELESVKIGRSRRISRTQLEAYVQRLELAAQRSTACLIDAALSKRPGFPY